MGIRDKLARMQGNAAGKVEVETAKLNKQLADLEASVVERMNWMMKLQQKIADKLEVEVEDRLEE